MVEKPASQNQLHVEPLDLGPTPVSNQTINSNVARIYPMSNSSTDGGKSSRANKKQFLSKPWQKGIAVVGGFLLITLLLGGVLGFYTYGVMKELQAQGAEVRTSSQTALDNFKSQNLPGTKEQLLLIQEKLKAIRETYGKIAVYNLVPIARNYYQDGVHGLNAADAGISAALKAEEAVAPYADVLGFKGQGTFSGGTTEDRLKVVLATLQKVTPQLDNISKDLDTVKTELALIDENRYPETIRGIKVKSSIVQAHEVSNGAATALSEFRPVLEQLPAIAGANGRKKYFILFQNDNELRPTGGFMTAYSIIYIENGKVIPDKSDDIYELDKKFNQKLPIPPELGKYLTTEKYWNLRDMNIYPDFKQSMDIFSNYYKQLPSEAKDIDGIIAVDTQVLTDLVRVLGPVEVPGYGTFSAETLASCDCPQIIGALSEIADRPTPYIRTDRKGILGPMMRNILTKAYSAPKTEWPKLFETGWKNIQGRHVQFYFFDQQAQAAAELAGAAGRLNPDPKAEDFFAVVDANLGGAKSNLYVSSSIHQEVSSPADGMITKKVTLTYKNNRKGSNCNLEAGLLCLNAAMPDWNRIYLPKGAKLIKSEGYKPGTVKQDVIGEFSVIDGEFTLQPLSQIKIIVEYSVPYTDTTTYKVKLWKQGGVTQVGQLMDVNGNQEQFDMTQDMIYQAKF